LALGAASAIASSRITVENPANNGSISASVLVGWSIAKPPHKNKVSNQRNTGLAKDPGVFNLLGGADFANEEQGLALRLVSGATMQLLSVALCVTRAPVYDAAGCALTVHRAAPRAEDET